MAKKRKAAAKRRIALITGATSGIGAEFARQLAARKLDLALVARDENRLNDFAQLLADEFGVSVDLLPVDLTEPEGLEQVERYVEDSGGLEMLINNAGFGFGRHFVENSADDHEKMIRLHVIAPVRLCRAALPAMIAAHKGSIINVSSVSAFGPGPGRVTYASTKGYLNTFSSGLSLELEGTGVTVQSLCPGYTRSEFHERANMKPKAPSFMWMTPEAVVRSSLDALPGGRVLVIPGIQNKVLTHVASNLPDFLVRQVIRRVGALARN